MEIEWKPGDRVIHPGKPEWGVGSVTTAQGATQAGQRCQRVTVRFENGGLKTVSTAFAKLTRARPGSGATETNNNSWLDKMESGDLKKTLVQLPESATDPFSSLESRLRETLQLYRFTNSGGSLLAWATAQTGLSDPLSRLNRNEIEQSFEKFRILLDRHLGQLVQQARQQGVDVAALAREIGPVADNALHRANRYR